jgi:hypothetical protein
VQSKRKTQRFTFYQIYQPFVLLKSYGVTSWLQSLPGMVTHWQLAALAMAPVFALA